MRIIEKRNKMQREEINYRENADGRADQSRVKRLLKNTSTCAQTFPSSLSTFFDFFALRDTHTHTHTLRLAEQSSGGLPSCQSLSSGKERYYSGTGAKLSHYVLHYDLIHLRKKLLADNRDPSSLSPVHERENAQRDGQIVGVIYLNNLYIIEAKDIRK